MASYSATRSSVYVLPPFRTLPNFSAPNFIFRLLLKLAGLGVKTFSNETNADCVGNAEVETELRGVGAKRRKGLEVALVYS
jgi:hypothetical protein